MKRWTTAIAAVAVATVWSFPAGAVEREYHLGADLGASMLMVSDKGSADFGPLLGAHLTYGLTDQFNLLGEAAFSLVSPGEHAQDANTPNTRPSSVARADVGLAYVLDVLRWVPWGGVLAGGYAITGGTVHGVRVLPGVAAAIGLDYRFDRSWSAGVSARWHFLVADMATYPSFIDVFARVEYSWGW